MPHFLSSWATWKLKRKEWMEQEMFFSSDEFNGTIDMALSLLWKMVWTPSIVPKFEAFRLFYRQKFAISKACALLLMREVWVRQKKKLHTSAFQQDVREAGDLNSRLSSDIDPHRRGTGHLVLLYIHKMRNQRASPERGGARRAEGSTMKSTVFSFCTTRE